MNSDTCRMQSTVGSFKYVLWVLAAIFLLMLVLNFLTPMVSDDYAYCFSFVDWERIESVGEIFPSMKMHREYANGRIVAHFFAQLFLLLPKGIFNVINALATTAIFFIMLSICGFERPGKSLFLLTAAFMLVWYFTPDFGQVFLWLDGACNYSWAILFSLLFLCPFFRLYSKGEAFSKGWLAVPFLVVSPLAGAYSESASCAMLFMAFCFFVISRLKHKKTPAILVLGFILACAGFLYMMSSPIEAGEKAVFSPGQVLFNFNYIFMSFRYYQAGIHCIFAAVLVLALMLKAEREKIVLAVLFYAGGFVSAAVFSFSAYFPPRALCPMSLYSTLAIILLVSALWEKGQQQRLGIAAGVLGMLFIFELVTGVYDISRIYDQSVQREALVAQAKAQGENHVALPAYDTLTKYSAPYGLEDVHEYSGNWVNMNMAKYYEFEYVEKAD